MFLYRERRVKMSLSSVWKNRVRVARTVVHCHYVGIDCEHHGHPRLCEGYRRGQGQPRLLALSIDKTQVLCDACSAILEKVIHRFETKVCGCVLVQHIIRL